MNDENLEGRELAGLVKKAECVQFVMDALQVLANSLYGFCNNGASRRIVV